MRSTGARLGCTPRPAEVGEEAMEAPGLRGALFLAVLRPPGATEEKQDSWIHPGLDSAE